MERSPCRTIAKGALVVVTLAALATATSVGAFVAPLLLPLHWGAAYGTGIAQRIGWIVLALPCSWLLGLFFAASIEADELVPAAIAVSIGTVVLFVTTTGPVLSDARRGKSGI